MGRNETVGRVRLTGASFPGAPPVLGFLLRGRRQGPELHDGHDHGGLHPERTVRDPAGQRHQLQRDRDRAPLQATERLHGDRRREVLHAQEGSGSLSFCANLIVAGIAGATCM